VQQTMHMLLVGGLSHEGGQATERESNNAKIYLGGDPQDPS